MVKKKEMDWKVVAIGLVCLTALEGFALYLGFNGTLLKIVLMIIAGAIGYTIPSPFTKK